jgi:putative hydrolase of the HAD superfamily
LLTYGTTMRGLQLCHQIDPDEYLAYVHDFPLQEYLGPNPQLDAVLDGIHQQKVVFTNASREHARRVLDRLGISRHFERILDVRDMAYESKPQPSAYHRACHLLNVQPEECIMVEDNVRNLRPAKALGMITVLVDGDGTDESVDHNIRRVEDIGQILQKIAGA